MTLVCACLAIAGHVLLSSGSLKGRAPDDGPRKKAADFWIERPYIPAPAVCEGIVSRPSSSIPMAALRLTEVEIALEAKFLATLCADVASAQKNAVLSTWGYAPAKGLIQQGLLSGLFLHRGPVHLLTSLFFIVLAGLLIEKRLGRVNIALIIVAGGVFVTAGWGFVDGDARPIVGASGSAALMLGATLRYAGMSRLSLLLDPRVIRIPIWVIPALWCFTAILGLPTGGPATSGALFMHLVGAGLGAGVADLVIRFAIKDERPKPKPKVTWSEPDSEHRLELARKATQEGRLDVALQHYALVVQSDPQELEALHGLARVSAIRKDVVAAKLAIERLFAACLDTHRTDLVPSLVKDLDSALEPARAESSLGRSVQPGVSSTTVRATPPTLALKLAHAVETQSPGLAIELYTVASGVGGLVGAKAHVAAAELALRRQIRDVAERHATAALEGEIPAELRKRAELVLASLSQS